MQHITTQEIDNLIEAEYVDGASTELMKLASLYLTQDGIGEATDCISNEQLQVIGLALNRCMLLAAIADETETKFKQALSHCTRNNITELEAMADHKEKCRQAVAAQSALDLASANLGRLIVKGLLTASEKYIYQTAGEVVFDAA